jgi:hypothetical protein
VHPLDLPGGAGLPGVDTALRGVLSKLITRRLVEPQRRYFDLARMYANKHVARVRVLRVFHFFFPIMLWLAGTWMAARA